jgi:hypothetical protein
MTKGSDPEPPFALRKGAGRSARRPSTVAPDGVLSAHRLLHPGHATRGSIETRERPGNQFQRQSRASPVLRGWRSNPKIWSTTWLLFGVRYQNNHEREGQAADKGRRWREDARVATISRGHVGAPGCQDRATGQAGGRWQSRRGPPTAEPITLDRRGPLDGVGESRAA